MKTDFLKSESSPANNPVEALSSIVINNRTISFKKSGSGPPLIVFHGWIGNEDTFSSCHAAFAPYYTVYRLAWPGYGKSSPIPDFSIGDLAETGRHLIDATGNAPVTIIGICLGGIAAVELIRRYPALVKQLVLIEMYDYMPWYMYPLLVPGLNIFLYKFLFKNVAGLDILHRLFTFKMVRHSEAVRYIRQAFLRTDARAATDFLKAVKRFQDSMCREQYTTDIPTIYVEGGRSIPPISAFRETAHKYFRNLTFMPMPESLHLPAIEQPELFSARLLHHLGKASSEF